MHNEACTIRRQPLYLVWLASDTAKDLSRALYGFALPLLALMLTNDPSKAGLLGAMTMVVILISTLYGGVVADRSSRIRLMIIGSCIGLIIAVIFLAMTVTWDLAFWMLALVSAGFALRNGIFGVAAESALKDVVPAKLMGQAQAANQGRDAAIGLVAGPIGGLLLSVGAALTAAVLVLLNVTAAASALVLGRLWKRGEHHREDRPSDKTAASSSALSEAIIGLKLAWKRTDLRSAILSATIVNVGMNAFISTTVYSLQQEGYTTLEIGGLSFTMGLSLLLGSVLASRLVTRIAGGTLILSGVVLVAGGAVAMVMTNSLISVMVVSAVAVALLPSVNAALMGYFIVSTPSEYMGRALAAASVLSMGALPLAPLIAGFGLSHLGRTGTLLICAGLCVAVAVVATSSKAIRSIPSEDEWEEYAAQYTEGQSTSS